MRIYRWTHSAGRFSSYQNLQYGERYWIYDNTYFRFRQGSVPGISKFKPSGRRMWRTQSMAEKRQWFDYEEQFKDNGFFVRRRRTSHELITSYDDIPKNSYRGSWKHSTKKSRQWGGITELIFCG